MKRCLVLLDNVSTKQFQCCVVSQQCVHAKTWVEVSRSALRHNIENYKKILGNIALAPVIKSNAYGHGMILIAQMLQQIPEVELLCVVSLSEAIELRVQGITKKILVLSILDADFVYAVEYDIQLVVFDSATLKELNALACSHKKQLRVHFKFDTGLSRLGVFEPVVLSLVEEALMLPGIRIEGIFSHLANSEQHNQSFAHHQINRFITFIEMLELKGIVIPAKHITCSAAITALSTSHLSLARCGVGIYGLWPSAANKLITQQTYPDFSLKPVLQWKTKPIQIKHIPAGSTIGYDLTYRTAHDSTIAVLPVGYWDGYDRGFSNKAHVVIHGTTAPVVGRIAMNLIMVDVTHIRQITLSDEVTLLGNHESISAQNLAQLIDTINYEVVTRINPLIKRIAVD